VRFDHDQPGALNSDETRENLGPVGINLFKKGGLPLWLATVAGVGLFPLAPGTAGSAAACLAFFFSQSFGLSFHLALLALTFTVGVWASGASEGAFGKSDDGRIVIDEVVGQWIALVPHFFLAAPFVPLVVTAFVAFRVFDIAKPGPVRWAERRFRGGLGVMADDVVAGGFAALTVGAVFWLWSVM
jgi:phosphatidylglycerophosphatase A